MYFKTVINGEIKGVFQSTQDFTSEITFKIYKSEYDILAKEIEIKQNAEEIAKEEAAKPAREYEAKIQAKIREMAIKEIEKEVILKK